MAGYDVRKPTRVTSHFHMRGARGFTLIELVAVIILVAILGAMGVSRFMDRKAFDADAYYDITKTMLRYGQKLAIAQNRAVYVRLNGEVVALCFDAACNQKVSAPSGANSGANRPQASSATNCQHDSAWYCEEKAAGVSYTTTVTSFFFDEAGRPFPGGAAVDAALSNYEPADIVISGDGKNRALTVERDTGYVH
jgi:MSHA pilin protein MshC